MTRTTPLLACLMTLLPAGATAQRTLDVALADPSVRMALERVERRAPETAAFLARIGAIVSPSGQERERAEAVAARMSVIGLQRVEVDDESNVVGVIPGRSGRLVVFVSTLDDLATVAAHQQAAPHPPRVEGERVVGPGTNTSATTAAMLSAAEAVVASGLTPRHTMVFAAVAQEETGLIGMKALYDRLGGRAAAFIDILGDGRSISYGALEIHWWKVQASGPPGHTLRGALPNVNQGIGRAVDRLLMLPQARQGPDTGAVLNIAILSSGEVFNHKPAEGWFSLDLRSREPRLVAALEEEVRAILAETARATEVGLSLEPYRSIPGGQLPGGRGSALVRTSASIARHLGLEPRLSDAGSSNMNVAIAGGTPAIGLGGERGGERGQPGEWADIPAMVRSAQHVVLLAATIGEARGAEAPASTR